MNRAGAFRQEAIVHAFDLGKVKLEITFTLAWISRWIYLVDSYFIFRFFFFRENGAEIFFQFLFTLKKGFSDIVDFCKEFSINTSVSFMVERIIPELKQFFFFTNIME